MGELFVGPQSVVVGEGGARYGGMVVRVGAGNLMEYLVCNASGLQVSAELYSYQRNSP